MTVKTKTVDIEVKADAPDGEGQFTGYASVFGNKDSYGDVVLPGAFAESLKTFGPNGSGIPVYWRHRMDDPYMLIGQTIEAKEDERGLFVHVQLDTSINNGAQTYKLLKAGLVKQMSFAYDVVEGALVESENDGYYYELRKLTIHEVSVVPVGANQETEILAVKSAALAVAAGVKAGQIVPTEAREDLEGAITALKGALATTTDQEKAAGTPDAKDEEPPAAKSEEQTTVPAARALAEATIQGLL
ncbi:peptidase U35 [Curtobacterium citreum]|uniref:HK97 family phage prohead protease n=2 Tax=Curtobacterium TaxID=2034 RepID=A0ABT2HDM1_9MICO|nr:HK97 family phage prohead protease [Curtobacterium citreum]MCS6521353.1 HK97 family phage prohead protease [Curtobacterium citreum]TQJ28212.1 hypothetical protein FB462_2092 [Curtobacterium citreum]GGL76925.1 peptidase U35 [Curtobacterium citreum]